MTLRVHSDVCSADDLPVVCSGQRMLEEFQAHLDEAKNK